MAWSNSHRPLPHSQINLRERSQRTAADLVWRARTALTRIEAAGMLQGTSSPRHALLSLCAKHALTPDVHTHTHRGVTRRFSPRGASLEEMKRKYGGDENSNGPDDLKTLISSGSWVFWKILEGRFRFEAYALYSYSNPQIKTLAVEPLAGKSALCKAHECTILCKQKRLQLIAWGR